MGDLFLVLVFVCVNAMNIKKIEMAIIKRHCRCCGIMSEKGEREIKQEMSEKIGEERGEFCCYSSCFFFLSRQRKLL